MFAPLLYSMLANGRLIKPSIAPPAGGINYLERSDDLRDWQIVETNTSPYIWCPDLSMNDPPRAFFRAKQER